MDGRNDKSSRLFCFCLWSPVVYVNKPKALATSKRLHAPTLLQAQCLDDGRGIWGTYARRGTVSLKAKWSGVEPQDVLISGFRRNVDEICALLGY